jgi:hypothetical protein
MTILYPCTPAAKIGKAFTCYTDRRKTKKDWKKVVFEAVLAEGLRAEPF